MAVTKDQLTARTRGKGGTIVRIVNDKWGVLPELERDTYVVKDLMNRKTYDQPDRIGIGPADLGVAFGVNLSEIEIVR